MVKATITRNELAQMLMDQLDCEKVRWDEQGNAQVVIDFNKLKENKTIVEKHDHWHYREYPRWTWTSTSTTPNTVTHYEGQGRSTTPVTNDTTYSLNYTGAKEE